MRTTLRLPTRGGGTVIVRPDDLHTPFAHMTDVRQYQVVHGDGGLRVRVVLAADALPGAPKRVRDTLALALRIVGADDPAVTVEPVAAIARGDASAGGPRPA